MITLPREFSDTISVFAPLFRKKVFEHAKVLLLGSVLTLGRRTVCSALRTVGLGGEKSYHKYHRVLSLSKWSCLEASRLLLKLLVKRFADASGTLVFGLDETIERRWGAKIKARGIYRDSVRSSHGYFVKCSGLKWMCLMLLAPVSWADRIWALPFLSVLAPSERYYKERAREYKKLTDWARQIILQLHRWMPDYRLVILGDMSYTCYELLNAVRGKVCMITPLRKDARLFDFPNPNPAGKRGPKPKVGQRQPILWEYLNDPGLVNWQKIRIPLWYGQEAKWVLVASGLALWYKSGFAPVPMRWLLIRDPEEKIKPKALQCTDLDMSAEQIIRFYIRRWSVEVTFEEVRAHLGVETQRQWSDLAIARTTPVLMGLFSIVTLWADQLQQQNLLVFQTSAWYQKSHPTFSDAIASVRYRIWQKQKFLTSLFQSDVHNLKAALFKQLIYNATRAA